jgi:hypothetical protein
MSTPRAWLVLRLGSSTATRFPVRNAVTRIGRDADNDLVVEGPGSSAVSGHHLEIHQDGLGYRVVDAGSTNGTFLNGERVTAAPLSSPAVLHLGASGIAIGFEIATETETTAASEPTVSFARPQDAAAALSHPQVGALAPTGAPAELPATTSDTPDARRATAVSRHEAIVTAAVQEARQAREAGLTDQTGAIMRKMLGVAVKRSSRKFKTAIGALVVVFGALAGTGLWRIQQLEAEKRNVDRQIIELDALLEHGGQDPQELDRLAAQIDVYQKRAQAVQDNILYRLGTLGRHDAFVQSEIKRLMKDFGAETYSIPPEFVSEVTRFITQLEARDRANVEMVLRRRRGDVDVMRQILVDQKLPADLVFIVLVESVLRLDASSAAGAVGPWQLTPVTARAYGLRVDDAVDERTDLRKSTVAASRYIRDLILEFGAGSSVMLALAAYNVGPGRVKRAVQRVVEDPIKQRNFWYLYRVRALPAETRQYVPKIVAAIIIGRNPERFGF